MGETGYYARLRHELRTPLNAIIGYSEMLLEDSAEQGHDIAVSKLKDILKSGRQLLEAVDELFGTEGTDTKKEKVNRKRLSNDIRRNLRTPLNEIIGLSESLMEEAKKKAGMENLLSDLKRISSAANYFLSVVDDINIPEEEGEQERGTDTVETSAPAVKAKKSGVTRSIADDDAVLNADTGGHILVVDDDPMNRDLLSRQLERQGHTIAAAENGRQALETMKKYEFDMVLLDIIMPHMDGFEVLKHMKDDDYLQDVPVVVVSALDEMEDVVRCLQMGAEDYLLKPFNPVLLKARISTCLERKRLREMREALEVQSLKGDVKFIAESEAMKNVLGTVRSVSRSPVNVLIHGESGTGKEMIARMIHNGSDRSDGPFVAVNCASIPENLMESEFFGYEKGAFTGAVSSRGGRFEEASGGTLFLDEIGDMPTTIQPKFLRVIQEGEGGRLGSSKSMHYDLRIISATNRDIRHEVAEGRFREDLFYRIFSVEINIPPLRERREDIVPIASVFLNGVSRRFEKKISGFSSDALKFFEEYPWPGNVRQLLHEVERLVALTPDGGQMSLKHCSQELQQWRSSLPVTALKGQSGLSLHDKVRELETTCINEALRQTNGNKLKASGLLGITRQGLDKKMKRYNISTPPKSIG